MAKRRTKKEKLNPKHPMTISWQPKASEAKNTNFEANVKRQLLKEENETLTGSMTVKLAKITDKNGSSVSVKKDLVKSLVFASLIIASEVMIYLVWYK